jgi:hypothetical protein
MPCGQPSNLSRRGDAAGHYDGTSERDLGCRRRGAAAPSQLVPTRQVLHRRGDGVRDQPRRLRGARPLGGHALHPCGDLLVPRRRHEQLHLEPGLDLGLRFLVVSTIALAGNLVFLAILVGIGVPKIPAQAIAIALVTPWNFVANKLWSFRRQPAA